MTDSEKYIKYYKGLRFKLYTNDNKGYVFEDNTFLLGDIIDDNTIRIELITTDGTTLISRVPFDYILNRIDSNMWIINTADLRKLKLKILKNE
jgi:hypothetical protein